MNTNVQIIPPNISPKRKLILSMNVTEDGFLSGPNCELDWHFNTWTTEMAECLAEELKKADSVIFGRITYNAMAAYWSAKGIDLTGPVEDRAFAEMLNTYTKIVFSDTLKHTVWNNTITVKEDPEQYIKKMKKEAGDPVMIYGSAKLAGYLIEKNLIDEFHLWVHPVKLIKGKPLFGAPVLSFLELEKTRQFRNGVVLHYYKLKV
ncbi:dihydrofolate reductase family protein [Flavobacterium alkalisoli]|nr:dihydrofolate reductase family protein [Flavobacterium alkalisoli]